MSDYGTVYLRKGASPGVHSKKKIVYAIVLAAIAVIGGVIAYVAVSDKVSFSVVMSQSMQHDQYKSSLGIIDTGDVVLVKDVEHSKIESFVEGTQTGYKTFGDYGSVIIYDRGTSKNPVIHRAIVWVDYDAASGTWSSEDLKGYKGDWYCITNDGKRTKDWSDLSGTLYFDGLTQSQKNVSVSLGKFTSSGFLTMGDNVANNTFDQNAGITDHLISLDNINSVPFQEIPWLGTLKIYFKNNGANLDHVPNSMPSLVMFIALLFGILFLVDMLTLRRNSRELKKELDTIVKERRPPPHHFHWKREKGMPLTSRWSDGGSSS
jgi:signal peptidase